MIRQRKMLAGRDTRTSVMMIITAVCCLASWRDWPNGANRLARFID